MNQALLHIQEVSKSFYLHDHNKSIEGCRDINISLYPGEFVGITGKSGSGKSTILKLIYGTYIPQKGSILYDSEAYGMVNLYELSHRQRIFLRQYEIGYVSQFLQVVPRTTALTILIQAGREKGLSHKDSEVRAIELLTHFELSEELWDSYPATFSGGEKLRLNIARAMVKEPRLLLLDEPTASLDHHSKGKVRSLIAQLKERGTTMLGIFHDLEFMEGLCDREHHMSQGQMEALC
ncbi:phosphonate C-P lyase system protein PhnL [Spirochaeta cellobiosiphila]|uniref:phosphonate C-P lyase system protein PhnL n=1 Tax=Spirochaeta cellobiosiphila TaxID=504483 RepID=UPI00041C3ABA|nr:ATP-binding cassette domain-containing protein [Spirochaeta cellobiosiphila]